MNNFDVVVTLDLTIVENVCPLQCLLDCSLFNNYFLIYLCHPSTHKLLRHVLRHISLVVWRLSIISFITF